MADKRCENGHFIDESWDICPYCPQDLSEPAVPVVRPRAVDFPTAPVTSPSIPTGAPPATGPRRLDDDGGRSAQRASSGTKSALAVAEPMERTVAASQINMQKRYVVGWLVSLSGASRGESYPVRMGRNVIGRDRKSDIVVSDDQASSHHADLVFRPEEKRFILMDHNSTNGTYVNEAEIEPRRDLLAKDVIRIGSQRFIFTPLCHEGFHWDDEGPLK